jgi:26S proteasome regulatory subunit T4
LDEKQSNTIGLENLLKIDPIKKMDDRRNKALNVLQEKIMQHKDLENQCKNLRSNQKELKELFEKTEDNLKSLQSVGQIIGEVLKQLDDERCILFFF